MHKYTEFKMQKFDCTLWMELSIALLFSDNFLAMSLMLVVWYAKVLYKFLFSAACWELWTPLVQNLPTIYECMPRPTKSSPPGEDRTCFLSSSSPCSVRQTFQSFITLYNYAIDIYIYTVSLVDDVKAFYCLHSFAHLVTFYPQLRKKITIHDIITVNQIIIISLKPFLIHLISTLKSKILQKLLRNSMGPYFNKDYVKLWVMSNTHEVHKNWANYKF